tara:strand:+ start:483 stop:1274 length:792 start_codon:yes stop_codon:yes gene_type:complete
MRFTMKAKKLRDYLEDVYLKGRYYNGHESKNGALSEYAVLLIEGNAPHTILNIVNASASVACRIDHWFTDEDNATGMCVVDISAMLKHLKVIGGDVTFTSDDYITLSSAGKKASMSKVLTHPHMDMISRITNYDMTQLTGPTIEGTPSVGGVSFGKTEYECKLSTVESDMIEASKTCDVLGVARYKFEYDGEKLTISSKKSEVDKVEVEIELLEGVGDPSTVEFTGPFSGFMHASVTIYMKDDSPILFSSANRMMIKAPYLTR